MRSRRGSDLTRSRTDRRPARAAGPLRCSRRTCGQRGGSQLGCTVCRTAGHGARAARGSAQPPPNGGSQKRSTRVLLEARHRETGEPSCVVAPSGCLQPFRSSPPHRPQKRQPSPRRLPFTRRARRRSSSTSTSASPRGSTARIPRVRTRTTPLRLSLRQARQERAVSPRLLVARSSGQGTVAGRFDRGHGRRAGA